MKKTWGKILGYNTWLQLTNFHSDLHVVLFLVFHSQSDSSSSLVVVLRKQLDGRQITGTREQLGMRSWETWMYAWIMKRMQIICNEKHYNIITGSKSRAWSQGNQGKNQPTRYALLFWIMCIRTGFYQSSQSRWSSFGYYRSTDYPRTNNILKRNSSECSITCQLHQVYTWIVTALHPKKSKMG